MIVKLTYNRAELLNKINSLKIYKESNLIITEYFGRKIASVKVSERYEIFDFASYINEILPIIEKSFNIHKYELSIRAGRQHLRLYSDEVKVMISGSEEVLTKTFNITSSSDKSRALNFNLGLHINSSDVHLIANLRDAKTYKKHLTGITNHVHSFDNIIDDAVFSEQIELISALSQHTISLKDLKEVIYDGKTKTSWDKFFNLKKIILNRFAWNSDQITKLCNNDPTFEYDNSVQVSAYSTFLLYMTFFKREDSYIISKETKSFLEIRNVIKRNNKLKNILV